MSSNKINSTVKNIMEDNPKTTATKKLAKQVGGTGKTANKIVNNVVR